MRYSTLLALVLTGATAVPVLAARAAEELLKPADQEKLGVKIGKYFEALNKNEKIDKAKEDLSKELEGFRPKLKGRDPLSLTVDLGKALWQSKSYDTAKEIAKGKVKERSFETPYYGKKASLTYAVWVPAKYDPKRAYPLIVCIPEKGVKPMQHLTEKWIDPSVREGAILVGVPMPDDVVQWMESGSEQQQGGFANLMLTLRDVRSNYAIDYDRVYLAGRGEGVAAAAAIAARSPDRFAGVIGRSGDLDAKVPGHENFKNLPTFFAGAGANASAFNDACAKDGYNNCGIKADALESDVWAWIQDHPRMANPPEVVLFPGKETPLRAYWVEVPASDHKSVESIRAKVDKATNTITIDATDGITKVTLYLNDVLVDLDKEVKVICNGAEHVDKLPRNLWATMNWMYDSLSDPGRVFTASRLYDVPPKPKPKDNK